MESRDRPKYWSLVATSPTLTAELELIPPGSTVLEIGPGPGHMTQALRDRGCQVTVIERDPLFAVAARPFCKELIIGDIERLDIARELGDARFDVILLGDVLEHLRSPHELIQALTPHVAPGGFLVVSVPNVAHASVRLALWQGAFRYQTEGLLDRTHLRFFTLDTLVELFTSVGYRISHLSRIQKPFLGTEVEIDPVNLPAAALRQLCEDAESATYQFVFRAAPVDRDASSELRQDPRTLTNDAWDSTSARRQLATAVAIHAWVAFTDEPPRRRDARRLSFRSFAVSPNSKALLYLLLSLAPDSVVRVVRAMRSRTNRR